MNGKDFGFEDLDNLVCKDLPKVTCHWCKKKVRMDKMNFVKLGSRSRAGKILYMAYLYLMSKESPNARKHAVKLYDDCCGLEFCEDCLQNTLSPLMNRIDTILEEKKLGQVKLFKVGSKIAPQSEDKIFVESSIHQTRSAAIEHMKMQACLKGCFAIVDVKWEDYGGIPILDGQGNEKETHGYHCEGYAIK